MMVDDIYFFILLTEYQWICDFCISAFIHANRSVKINQIDKLTSNEISFLDLIAYLQQLTLTCNIILRLVGSNESEKQLV